MGPATDNINRLHVSFVQPNFKFTHKLVFQIRNSKKRIQFFLQVANTAVRHMGTLAGNLMIKHTWNEFPSDIFVMLVLNFFSCS